MRLELHCAQYGSNPLLQRVKRFLYWHGEHSCVTVFDKDFAVSVRHCFPNQQLGEKLDITDQNGGVVAVQVHGISESDVGIDVIVFRRVCGTFNAPALEMAETAQWYLLIVSP